jgi:hypothetical protein
MKPKIKKVIKEIFLWLGIMVAMVVFFLLFSYMNRRFAPVEPDYIPPDFIPSGTIIYQQE